MEISGLFKTKMIYFIFHLSLLSAADVPFSRWSREEVSGWLQEQGLGFYAIQGQNWIKSGQTLLQASQHDLEKVWAPSSGLLKCYILCSDPLTCVDSLVHRNWAWSCLSTGRSCSWLYGQWAQSRTTRADWTTTGWQVSVLLWHHWTLDQHLTLWLLSSGWLDDIGLPQYKSHFEESCVDGRVLHHMTVVSDLHLTFTLHSVELFTCWQEWCWSPGRPPVSEGGECPPPPQHQESHPGAAPEQLWRQLSEETAVRRGKREREGVSEGETEGEWGSEW